MAIKNIAAMIVLLCGLFGQVGISQAGIVVEEVNLSVNRGNVAEENSRSINFTSTKHTVVADSPFVFSIIPNQGDPLDDTTGTGVRISSAGNSYYAVINGSINIDQGTSLGSDTPGVAWEKGESILHHFSMTGPFLDNEIGFLGVRYTNGANTHYGWISYEALETSVGNSRGIIGSWGIQNEAGVAVIVGVPEPSAFLLVGSVMCLGFVRRRRNLN